MRTLCSVGTFTLSRVTYILGGNHRNKQLVIIVDGDKASVADLDGEILIDHTRPAAALTYVGNGRLSGPRPKMTAVAKP